MSPWFSVWGLVADMAGVAIITYDIWPEYSLHRLRQDLEFQHRAVSAPAREHTSPDDGPELQTVAGMLNMMDNHRLDRLRQKAGLPALTLDAEQLTEEQIEASQQETVVALAARFSALHQRSRPPLGVGVFLVVAGFVLQMIGAWPH